MQKKARKPGQASAPVKSLRFREVSSCQGGGDAAAIRGLEGCLGDNASRREIRNGEQHRAEQAGQRNGGAGLQDEISERGGHGRVFLHSDRAINSVLVIVRRQG